VWSCYSTATVTGNAGAIGGIVGELNGSGSRVTASYSTGAITGNSASGGIAGYVFADAEIVGCVALNPSITRHASSSANSFGRVAGLVTSSTIINTRALSSMTLPGGANGNNGNTSINVAQAKTQSTYASFPFGTNESNPWRWGLSSAYPLPTLWFQSTAPVLPSHLN
jgi:hypothetical protein